jgi:hypothetical protein
VQLEKFVLGYSKGSFKKVPAPHTTRISGERGKRSPFQGVMLYIIFALFMAKVK